MVLEGEGTYHQLAVSATANIANAVGKRGTKERGRKEGVLLPLSLSQAPECLW